MAHVGSFKHFVFCVSLSLSTDAKGLATSLTFLKNVKVGFLTLIKVFVKVELMVIKKVTTTG